MRAQPARAASGAAGWIPDPHSMNISLNWLSTHLALSDKSPRELDDLLTFAGVEVEGVHPTGVACPTIVVAEIKEAVQHPAADRLKVCHVDAGEGSLRQIVCGAQNYKVGDRVPCALPGSALPGGFTIGETRMRGVESRGMLCAASEIGLTDAEDGLLILPADAPIGRPVKELFTSDVLLEIEVTPNRPDLLCHRGLAREAAALLKRPLHPLVVPARASEPAGDKIRLEAADGCPFYTAVRVSGVKIGASPAWLQQRLESIGLRPINNLVDITNFVLHELGQPLHAFDAGKVAGALVIRAARDGENFRALDGKIYQLESADLVISDEAGQALALGGVMGGEESGVTHTTTEILLESAWFTPSRIRRTSRRLGLSSDSSYRFERGVDPSAVLEGSALAVKMILELAGGSAEPVTLTAGSPPRLTSPVALDSARLDQLTGGAVSPAEAADILARLGLTDLGDGRWQVPSFRADLQRHIDLAEEIARVHGLDGIRSRFQAAYAPSSGVDRNHDTDMALRRQLAALGFFEAQTIKLISHAQLVDALPIKALQDGDAIRVSLPLSEDHAVMRPSIVPGLVATAARNVRQGAAALRFFEAGRVFRNAGGGRARDIEGDTLAILVAGPDRPASWGVTPRETTFHDLKAVIAALVPGHGVQFMPRERDGFALACDVLAGNVNLGVAARLRPARERELDFVAPVFVAELDLTKLRPLRGGTAAVEDLPQFPGSSRDAAMELPATTPSAEVGRVLGKLKEPLLTDHECFDVFRDPSGLKLAADRKSLAYRFHYRAPDRTLRAEEVDAAHQRVLAALAKSLPVKFR